MNKGSMFNSYCVISNTMLYFKYVNDVQAIYRNKMAHPVFDRCNTAKFTHEIHLRIKSEQQIILHLRCRNDPQ